LSLLDPRRVHEWAAEERMEELRTVCDGLFEWRSDVLRLARSGDERGHLLDFLAFHRGQRLGRRRRTVGAGAKEAADAAGEVVV